MCVLMGSGMGPEHEVEARLGSSRGVDGERNDAMSGAPLGSQSCLDLSTLLLGVLFLFY